MPDTDLDFEMFETPATTRRFDPRVNRLRRDDGRFSKPPKRSSVETLKALGYQVRTLKGGRDVLRDGETVLQSASLSQLERFAGERYRESTKGGAA